MLSSVRSLRGLLMRCLRGRSRFFTGDHNVKSTYNGEKFIEEQLDSLYRQKNVQVRILVRDFLILEFVFL